MACAGVTKDIKLLLCVLYSSTYMRVATFIQQSKKNPRAASKK